MMQYFAKRRQTRTRIHSEQEAERQQKRQWTSALRAMASVQMAAQGLLWITFYAYDRAQQATWQAAILQLIPLSAFWQLWRFGAGAMDSCNGRYVPLVLFPCLILDAALSLLALSGMIAQLIPQYPGWISVAAPAAACVITVLCARLRGVSYGAQLLKGWLVVLFVFGTMFLRASTRSDRLWPLLGSGIGNTAFTALHGAGSLWGAALLFALPSSEEKTKSVPWAVVPWALMCIWALWYGFLRPWASGDNIAIAEKMMGLARHASSVVLYEMAGLLWMFLLPLSLISGLASCERLVCRSFPKCPRWIPVCCCMLVPSIALIAWPAQGAALLETLLPYRAALCLLGGIALTVMSQKEKQT